MDRKRFLEIGIVKISMYIYTCTMMMKTVCWKVKGSITICTTMRRAKNNGEEGWTHSYKLALL